MRHRAIWLAGSVALITGCSGENRPADAGATAAGACERVLKLDAPDLRVTSATQETLPQPHCRVTGVIGKETNFVVWLPETWNGRLLMSGNGGLGGFIPQPPPLSLERGYAVTGTDTGHVGETPADARWAVGEMERQVNFAHLAVHRTTVAAKFVVKARYSRPADKSLFIGCSDGGRQGLMEAQRYPEDFDGVIAGSPVIDLRQHGLNQVTISRLNFHDGPEKGAIKPVDLALLHNAVLARCDANDGLKDGVVSDPLACAFDPKELACKQGQTDACLSAQKVAVADAIYRGTPLDGKPFAPGYNVGGETTHIGGWGWFVGGDPQMEKVMGKLPPAYAITSGPFLGGKQMGYYNKDAQGRWISDPAAVARDPELMTSTMSPTSPDLDAFRRRGGKLLMFHGWSDTSLPPRMTLNYVDAVYAHDPSARDDVRLFMEPGALHCGTVGGGPFNAPVMIDYLAALDAWVSGGSPPDALEQLMPGEGGVRKVCAYPKKPVFAGQGDGRKPEDFACE